MANENIDLEIKDSNKLADWYNKFYVKRGKTYVISEAYVRNILEKIGVDKRDKSKRLLDVACGGGHLIEQAMKFVSCWGIDISEVAVKEARERNPLAEISVANAEKLSFENEYFDFITCNSLERFVNMSLALKEMRRVLKEEGKVLLYLPNVYDFYIVAQQAFTGSYICKQVNARMYSLDDWKRIISRYFSIEKIYFEKRRYTVPELIYMYSDTSFARWKAILTKIIFSFFNIFIPKGLCYCFSMICRKHE